MVCTADDLLKWSDFPKGLRVLLLDEDCNSGALIRSKLEEMDYIVSVFCNENDALSAMSSKPESFHIAIVEVSTSNNNGAFKFLEVAKDLPTIMTSNKQCLATMMKCIALGAVEFLLKPLSDEKLTNIWQHVVHKAFNAGQKDLPDSLKLIKPVVPMLHIKLEEVNQPKRTTMSSTTVSMASARDDNNQEDLLSVGSDKYPAPSTPQLNQVVRLADDGDCPHQANCSTEKGSGGDQEAEAKSVDTISSSLAAETNVVQESPPQMLEEATVVKDEDEVADCSTRSESNMSSSPPQNNKDDDPCQSGGEVAKIPSKGNANHSSSGNKPNRKKMKVDWTPELHKKFVQAVEQLGVDQAIPSRILESMKVEGLTRHNVASHLQKYRMQRRHILPKEDERRWPQPRDTLQRSSYNYGHKPVIAYPPSYNHLHHSNLVQLPPAQFFPAWGPPGGYSSGGGVQSWGPAFYPPWQPPGPGMHADAWGCPVMPPPPPAPYQPYSPFLQNSNGFGSDHPPRHMNFSMPHNPDLDLLPAEEVIDKVVKEAINKPWLPLPLGLKAPSTDSVLTELSRQGISTVPPPLN